MLADALDAHNQLQIYQLPDAPPPPKLPPPPLNPPLSLELLPPEEPPQDEPPPDQLPLRPFDDATLSASMAKAKAMTAEIAENISDPTKSHANTPTTPPVASDPANLPRMVRRNAPPTKMPNRTSGLNNKSKRS